MNVFFVFFFLFDWIFCGVNEKNWARSGQERQDKAVTKSMDYVDLLPG